LYGEPAVLFTPHWEIPMKALVQLIGAMLTAVLPLLFATDHLSLTEWINVGVVGERWGTAAPSASEVSLT